MFLLFIAKHLLEILVFVLNFIVKSDFLNALIDWKLLESIPAFTKFAFKYLNAKSETMFIALDPNPLFWFGLSNMAIPRKKFFFILVNRVFPICFFLKKIPKRISLGEIWFFETYCLIWFWVNSFFFFETRYVLIVLSCRFFF